MFAGLASRILDVMVVHLVSPHETMRRSFGSQTKHPSAGRSQKQKMISRYLFTRRINIQDIDI
jgi:hypothetical protein